jgi:hypothetical protein
MTSLAELYIVRNLAAAEVAHKQVGVSARVAGKGVIRTADENGSSSAADERVVSCAAVKRWTVTVRSLDRYAGLPVPNVVQPRSRHNDRQRRALRSRPCSQERCSQKKSSDTPVEGNALAPEAV